MPIRDVELHLPARVPLPRVLSNRGANGIDGTVSAAFGAAAARPEHPVVLLIGDVALLMTSAASSPPAASVSS